MSKLRNLGPTIGYMSHASQQMPSCTACPEVRVPAQRNSPPGTQQESNVACLHLINSSCLHTADCWEMRPWCHAMTSLIDVSCFSAASCHRNSASHLLQSKHFMSPMPGSAHLGYPDATSGGLSPAGAHMRCTGRSCAVPGCGTLCPQLGPCHTHRIGCPHAQPALERGRLHGA